MRDRDETGAAVARARVLSSELSSEDGGGEVDAGEHRHRLDRLIERLPPRLRRTVRWLRKPSSRWARIPAGVLLTIGGLLWILPLLGLWMLPVGLLLLADDIALLGRGRARILERLERRRPHWFAAAPASQPASIAHLDKDAP